MAIAVVVALLLGWRRPARSVAPVRPSRRQPAPTVRVARVVPEPYKRPNPIRRLIALALSGAMGVLIGTLLAIVISFALAFVVMRLTDMLA